MTVKSLEITNDTRQVSENEFLITRTEFNNINSFSEDAISEGYQNGSCFDDKYIEYTVSTSKGNGRTLNFEAVKLLTTKVFEHLGDGDRELGLQKFIKSLTRTELLSINDTRNINSKANYSVIPPSYFPYQGEASFNKNFTNAVSKYRDDEARRRVNEKHLMTMQFEESRTHTGIPRAVFTDQVAGNKGASICLYTLQVLERLYLGEVVTKSEKNNAKPLHFMLKLIIDKANDLSLDKNQLLDLYNNSLIEVEKAPRREVNKGLLSLNNSTASLTDSLNNVFSIPSQEKLINNLNNNCFNLFDVYKVVVNNLLKTPEGIELLPKIGISSADEAREIIIGSENLIEEISNKFTEFGKLDDKFKKATHLFINLIQVEKLEMRDIFDMSNEGIKYRVSTSAKSMDAYDSSMVFPLQYLTDAKVNSNSPLGAAYYKVVFDPNINNYTSIKKEELGTDKKLSVHVLNVGLDGLQRNYTGNVHVVRDFKDAIILKKALNSSNRTDLIVTCWGTNVFEDVMKNLVKFMPKAMFIIDVPNSLITFNESKKLINASFDLKLTKNNNLQFTPKIAPNIVNHNKFNVEKFVYSMRKLGFNPEDIKSRIIIHEKTFNEDLAYFQKFTKSRGLEVVLDTTLRSNYGKSIHDIYKNYGLDSVYKDQVLSDKRYIYNTLVNEMINSRNGIYSLKELSTITPEQITSSTNKMKIANTINNSLLLKNYCQVNNIQEKEFKEIVSYIGKTFISKLQDGVTRRDKLGEKYFEHVDFNAPEKHQSHKSVLRDCFKFKIESSINLTRMLKPIKGQSIQISELDLVQNTISQKSTFERLAVQYYNVIKTDNEYAQKVLKGESLTKKAIGDHIVSEMNNAIIGYTDKVIKEGENYYLSLTAEKRKEIQQQINEIKINLGAKVAGLFSLKDEQQVMNLYNFIEGNSTKLELTINESKFASTIQLNGVVTTTEKREHGYVYLLEKERSFNKEDFLKSTESLQFKNLVEHVNATKFFNPTIENFEIKDEFYQPTEGLNIDLELADRGNVEENIKILADLKYIQGNDDLLEKYFSSDKITVLQDKLNEYIEKSKISPVDLCTKLDYALEKVNNFEMALLR